LDDSADVTLLIFALNSTTHSSICSASSSHTAVQR
jgi:hypothetical protein